MLFSKSHPPTGFYIYFYLREDGTPYYIGKGKDKRAWAKHNVNIPKNDQQIVFVAWNLLEIGAFILERRFIRWYGRKDNDTGILRNMTDGGEGPSGFKHSEESKEKNRISNSGTNNPYYGVTGVAHFNHGRKNPKVSEYQSKLPRTPESNQKRRNTLLSKKDQHHTKTQKYRDSVSGENNPMFGKKRLDLVKRNSRKCVSPSGEVFDSLKEAGLSCGKSGGSIYGLIIRGVSGWKYES
jgi:hypothetical protein